MASITLPMPTMTPGCGTAGIAMGLIARRRPQSNDPVNATLMSAIKTKVEAVAVEIRASHFECPHDHSSEAAFDDLAWMTKH
jgi:hypothetical protein